MRDAIIDLVVPVWNRPNETRNCLVNLINFTPASRLIMYDSGSERETERILQEFADGLDDDAALLMRDDSNIGFVRSANRGLERCEAPYRALIRNTTAVSEGWLDPLLAFAAEHPEAGILLPCFTPAPAGCQGPLEVAEGSFAAMVITGELYRQIGGFDEGLDGGLWCLRDYTRRACANGFLTFQVPGPAVAYQEEVLLGSERRRKETLERTLAIFRERWGEGGSFVIHVPKGVTVDHLRTKIDLLVQGARHGNIYTLLLPATLFKEAQQAGVGGRHENVRLVSLPRFPGNLAKKKVYERIRSQEPGTVPVSAVDGIAFPWSDSYLSFAELTERIMAGYRLKTKPHPELPLEGEGVPPLDTGGVSVDDH